MPSFLSKVFGRKKDEKEGASPTTDRVRQSPPTLLDGKYEAVCPTVSPTVPQFSEHPRQNTHPLKDSPLALFRSRSRTVNDQLRSNNVESSPAPHLTLNLPAQKEANNRALGVVFEAVPEEAGWLSEAVIGERRLHPLEALLLVQACSRAIIDHGGLEALGLMHPHWYAASAEVQRKLISLFIISLQPNSRTSMPADSSTSISALFDTELAYTRSTHDTAAVLRWALRHLQLEGDSFGKDASEWGWYATFATAEKEAHFPPASFSQTLVPLLPPAHLQLLTATLDIISSLAAHAETTGTSGSKLAKLFGLWLVSPQRAKQGEDWATFYRRWESAGRVLEHLFLSYVREEVAKNRMPLRLSELVKQYPYSTRSSAASEELPFLTRPRFSTRRSEALVVRIDSQLPTMTAPRPPRRRPLRIISEAIKASAASDADTTQEALAVWEDIQRHASDAQTSGVSLTLTGILDDETLRILALLPEGRTEPSSTAPTATLPPTSPVVRTQPNRRRSSSLGPPANGGTNATSNGHDHNGATSPTDWADFSKLGFGDSSLENDLTISLNDNDVETTSPKPSSPAIATWSKKRRASSPGRGRRSSADSPRPGPTEQRGRAATDSKVVYADPGPARLAYVGTAVVDEAFFDFWSDSLFDPIASDWPSFVVCQLKPSTFKYNLLVIEHTFSRPIPPPLPPIPQFEQTRRPSSPRPSVSTSTKGRRSFNFSPTMKRFSFFSNHNSSATDVTSKPVSKKGSAKAPKSPRIGEMGEVVPEEEESVSAAKQAAPVEVQKSTAEPVQGLGITGTSTTDTPVSVPAQTEESKQNSLPPAPLVEAEAIPASASEPAHFTVEPVKTEEEEPARPIITANTAASITEDNPAGIPEGEDSLPDAPEALILTGSTPGPAVALATSESATLAHAYETNNATSNEPPSEPAAADEPSIEANGSAKTEPTEELITDTVDPSTSPPAVDIPAIDDNPSTPLPAEQTSVEPAQPEPTPEQEAPSSSEAFSEDSAPVTSPTPPEIPATSSDDIPVSSAAADTSESVEHIAASTEAIVSAEAIDLPDPSQDLVAGQGLTTDSTPIGETSTSSVEHSPLEPVATATPAIPEHENSATQDNVEKIPVDVDPRTTSEDPSNIVMPEHETGTDVNHPDPATEEAQPEVPDVSDAAPDRASEGGDGSATDPLAEDKDEVTGNGFDLPVDLHPDANADRPHSADGADKTTDT